MGAHVLKTRAGAFRCFAWETHRPVRYALVIVSVTVPPAASGALVRSITSVPGGAVNTAA